ncbi:MULTISPECIES: DUF1491 family protein [Nitratireductor]|uniref:DUF1491 family protein n=1 Tax=Nitratireductor TaxID=245876 RepID=UPI000D0E3233|nr:MULTISPECIES: DUF1491 family protein [Nitratireductor]PSM18164.1 DUF1491 domain-containing protein [Nitratireductor sp. StC3]
MRVTSDLFVSSLIRRAFAAGGFAAIVHRGATEAGAIFVVERGRNGAVSLFAPAPQTGYGEGRPGGRLFVLLPEIVDEDTLSRKLERELKFDPDAWVVELELSTPVSDMIDLATP